MPHSMRSPLAIGQLEEIPALIDQATEIVELPLGSLRPADSPRSRGTNREHVLLLAGTQQQLPPILVQDGSNRIVDGAHRADAAAERGQETIKAKLFRGNDHQAFLAAVYLNVLHGLPLSLADRRAAATRILTTYPTWSDRMVARVTGLDPKTVGRIRPRPSEESPQSNGQSEQERRLGRDGRIRPISAKSGKEVARGIFERDPKCSLRRAARAAGISPQTARGVREELRRHDVTDRNRTSTQRVTSSKDGTAIGGDTISSRCQRGADCEETLKWLARDPSLKYNQKGKAIVRLLAASIREIQQSEQLLRDVPPHCRRAVGFIATQCATEWKHLAEEIGTDSPEGLTRQ